MRQARLLEMNSSWSCVDPKPLPGCYACLLLNLPCLVSCRAMMTGWRHAAFRRPRMLSGKNQVPQVVTVIEEAGRGTKYLLAGVNDGKSWKKALRNRLLDNLEGRTDQCLGSDDCGKSCQNPHWIESAVRKAGPEARGVILRVLHQVCSLSFRRPGWRAGR